MEYGQAASASYIAVVRASVAKKGLDEALDAFALTVRSELPCYRTWIDDGAVCVTDTTPDGPRRCPSCEARADLKKTLGA